MITGLAVIAGSEVAFAAGRGPDGIWPATPPPWSGAALVIDGGGTAD